MTMTETVAKKTLSGKTYGYCRISTAKQSIERQTRNILREFPDAVIVEETFTGTTTRRPKWDRLKKMAVQEKRAGQDVSIVFDSVSRMSRDAEDGFALYQELYDSGIELVFLKEPHINTQTYKKSLEIVIPETGTAVDILLDGVKRYLMELAREQIRLAFEQAEKEVQDLHKRTSEGLMTAKLNGKQVGRVAGRKYPSRKQTRAIDLILQQHRDFGGSLDDEMCRQLIGCSRNSFYKYKKIAKT